MQCFLKNLCQRSNAEKAGGIFKGSLTSMEIHRNERQFWHLIVQLIVSYCPVLTKLKLGSISIQCQFKCELFKMYLQNLFLEISVK